jgi:hypothetical protein
MRTGYRSMWRWTPRQQRKRKRKPLPPRNMYVDVPGMGKCVLMSEWQVKQMRKQQRGK